MSFQLLIFTTINLRRGDIVLVRVIFSAMAKFGRVDISGILKLIAIYNNISRVSPEVK